MADYELWNLVLWCYGASALTIRFVMFFALPGRHSPSVATAWLLVILLWPWPGMIAYGVMGSNVLPWSRLQRHRRMLAHFHQLRSRMTREGLPGATVPQVPKALEPTVRLAEKLGYMGITGGNRCHFIADAYQMAAQLVADIDNATSEVNLLYYIFNDDRLGKGVLDALVRAAGRGVRCRLLVDGVGSLALIGSGTLEALRAKGVQAAVALPVQLFRRKAARFDLRNHRKLALIDRKIAFTGSHNITDPSYGRSNLVWHDVSLRIQGPVVRQLEAIFIEDWYVETGETLDTEHLFLPQDNPPGDWCIQTVPSGPSYPTENYQRLMLSSIFGAQQQITITTPYLIPDTSTLEAIEVASLRGAKVRLIVPERSDQFVASYAAKAYYSDLLRLGVDIYLYQDGLIHAKTVTIDDHLAFVGSSNFDIRSFALNFEINLVLYGTEATQAVHGIQRRYATCCRRLSAQRWSHRGPLRRCAESVTKLMSPLL